MRKIIIICVIGLILLINFSNFSVIASKEYQESNVGLSNQNTEYWGLCIGPIDFESGCDDFVSEAIATKKVLVRNGWKADHINALTGELEVEDVLGGISWLKSQSDSNDIIFILLSGHGGGGTFWLKKDTYITYKEIDKNLDQIEYKGMTIIVSSCHSGSAIPFLKQNKRVIIASCGMLEYSGYFFDIISGLTIAADIAGNKDGYVSIEESFDYINNYCKKIPDTNPIISDNYLGELTLTTYDNYRYKQFSPKILYNDAGASTYHIKNQGLGNQIRQSFISRGTKLTGILIEIGYWQGENNKLIFSLQDKSGNCLFEKDIAGIDLYPENENNNMWLTWKLIDIPDISITKGEEYFLVFKTNILQEDTEWYVAGTQKNVYADGEYLISKDGGTSWEEDPNNQAESLSFVLFGEGESDSNREKPFFINFLLKINSFFRNFFMINKIVQ